MDYDEKIPFEDQNYINEFYVVTYGERFWEDCGSCYRNVKKAFLTYQDALIFCAEQNYKKIINKNIDFVRIIDISFLKKLDCNLEDNAIYLNRYQELINEYNRKEEERKQREKEETSVKNEKEEKELYEKLKKKYEKKDLKRN